VVKPTLPANFNLVEDIHVDIQSNAEEAVQQSAMFVISLVRCGLSNQALLQASKPLGVTFMP